MITTAYKSKILKSKLDEDPLQRRVYFLTFIESLEMIFSQYKESFGVLLDYPTIGGEDIKDYVKNAIDNLLHVIIDDNSRMLIAEIPGNVVKFISKL